MYAVNYLHYALEQRRGCASPPNGWIKDVLGFRRFRFRGVEKVQAEWDLVRRALNIRRVDALAAC